MIDGEFISDAFFHRNFKHTMHIHLNVNLGVLWIWIRDLDVSAPVSLLLSARTGFTPILQKDHGATRIHKHLNMAARILIVILRKGARIRKLTGDYNDDIATKAIRLCLELL
jgi:hypothetical protein